MTRDEALKKIYSYLMTDILHGKNSKQQASMLLDFFENELKMEQVSRKEYESHSTTRGYIGRFSNIWVEFGWDKEVENEQK